MAKKEVKVKSHTRKTKSGKSVIVRAHTAKKNCSKRDCGRGDELLCKKKKDSLPVIKYNPEFDNGEPSKKPRRNPRRGVPKWMDIVNKITRQ